MILRPSQYSPHLKSQPMLQSSPSTSLHFNYPVNITVKPSPPPTTVSLRRYSAVSAAWATEANPSATSSSLYEILGIPFGATGDEIKAAYRRLARSCHPDVTASTAGEDRKTAANEFIKVHAAYATLSDPVKRADYDRRLCQKIGSTPATARNFAGLSSKPNSSSFCRYPRRNWETDQCW